VKPNSVIGHSSGEIGKKASYIGFVV
jgi:hypothetical protein